MSTSTDSLLPAIVPPPVVALPAPFVPSGVHPAALLFPPMQGTDFGMLVEDIDANGLREPIVVYQGLVLDGRNRQRACEVAGVPPRYVEWDGVGSPLAFVVSRNLHRRHLNESQRAVIGAQVKAMFEEESQARDEFNRFAKRPQAGTEEGGDDEKPREFPVGANLHPRLNEQAATMLNVSARSVATAAKVLEAGDEQVVEAIMSGSVSVSDAAAVAELPKEEQRQALEAVRSGRARTLRQAAELEPDDEPPAPAARDERDDREPPFSRKRLRIECKRFTAELDRLLRRLDTVTSVCGGPNDYTRRVRDCLTVALRAIHDCVNQFGKAKR
jgi:hypothetical protein